MLSSTVYCLLSTVYFQKNIRWLDVPVQHAASMGVLRGVGQVGHPLRGRSCGDGLRTALQPGRQAHAGAVGGNNVANSIFFSGLVHRHEMWVVEPRDDMTLTQKSGTQLGRDQHFGPGHLQSDVSIEGGIKCLEHQAESTASQLTKNLEPSELNRNIFQ